MFRSSAVVALLAAALVATTAPHAAAHEITWLGTPTGFYSIYRTTIVEGGSAAIDIFRDPHCVEANTAWVDYETTAGSAGSGDFQARSGTFKLDPANCPRAGDVMIPTLQDDAIEDASEWFRLDLMNPVGTRLREPRRAEIFIVDDDGPARVALLTAAESQYENRRSIDLTLVRAGDAQESATISYATVNGTAEAGKDYVAASDEITFSPSQRTKKVTVTLVDNGAIDGDRSFTVGLAPGDGADVAAPSETVVTILDDDSDSIAPKTRIHLPRHKKTYGPRRFMRAGMHILAQDAGSGVARIWLGIRQKLTTGGCRWWTGSKFITRKCASKRWIALPPSEFAVYFFPKKMASSVGTRVKHYTAYSKATDQAGNSEALRVGRNIVRFEIRG